MKLNSLCFIKSSRDHCFYLGLADFSGETGRRDVCFADNAQENVRKGYSFMDRRISLVELLLSVFSSEWSTALWYLASFLLFLDDKMTTKPMENDRGRERTSECDPLLERTEEPGRVEWRSFGVSLMCYLSSSMIVSASSWSSLRRFFCAMFPV